VLVCGPDAYEEARSLLVRRALEDGVPAVLLYVDEDGTMRRAELDR
jgi:hypothetical protein